MLLSHQDTFLFALSCVFSIGFCDSEFNWTYCYSEVKMKNRTTEEIEFSLRFRDLCYIPSVVKNNLIMPSMSLLNGKLDFLSCVKGGKLRTMHDDLRVGIICIDMLEGLCNVIDESIDNQQNRVVLGVVQRDFDKDSLHKELFKCSLRFPDLVFLTLDVFQASNFHQMLKPASKDLIDKNSTLTRYIQTRVLDEQMVHDYYWNKIYDVLTVTFIYLSVLLTVFFIGKNERKDIVFWNFKSWKAFKRRRAKITAAGKLPIPVIRLNYVLTFILIIFFVVIDTLCAYLRIFEIVCIGAHVFCCTVSFTVFCLRIANATKKLKNSIKLWKRYSIALLPGAVLGLVVAILIQCLDQCELVYVLWNISSFLICLTVLLHLNFQTLGAVLVMKVSIFIYMLVSFNVSFDRGNSPFEYPASIALTSEMWDTVTPLNQKFAYDIQIGDKHQSEALKFDCHGRNPFIFFFAFFVGNNDINSVPVHFFYPLWNIAASAYLAVFCLFYNLDHGKIRKKTFSVSIFVVSVTGFALIVAFSHETYSLTGLVQLAALLTLILVMAGNRKEIKLLFCGRDDVYYIYEQEDEKSRSVVSSGGDYSLCSSEWKTCSRPEIQPTNGASKQLPPVSTFFPIYDYIQWRADTSKQDDYIYCKDVNVARPRSAPASVLRENEYYAYRSYATRTYYGSYSDINSKFTNLTFY